MFLEKKDFAKNVLGFTLIEILVVFGLMMIVTTISVSFYNNFRAKEGVRSAVSVLTSNLRLARGKALLVQKPSGCTNLAYWYLQVSGGSVRYGYNCDGSNTYFPVTDFSSDIDVDNLVVQFEPLTGAKLNGPGTIEVASEVVSSYLEKIEIEDSGIINEL